jgi:hypothetical protein
MTNPDSDSFVGHSFIFGFCAIAIIACVLSVLCYARITNQIFRWKCRLRAELPVTSSRLHVPSERFLPSVDEGGHISTGGCYATSEKSVLLPVKDVSFGEDYSERSIVCSGNMNPPAIANSKNAHISTPAIFMGASLDNVDILSDTGQPQCFDCRHIQTPYRRSSHSSPFQWICDAADDVARRQRRVLALQTISCLNARSIETWDGFLVLANIDKMVQGTMGIRAGIRNEVDAVSISSSISPTRIRQSNLDALCESIALVEQSHRVALLNFASNGSPGGAFFAGGQHGPQESLCMVSSLFYSLRHAQQVAAGRDHIPRDGVIMSPKVDIFRHGASFGYSFRKSIATLNAVISLVLPNDEDQIDLDLVRSVLRSSLVAAIQSNAEVMVWPDLMHPRKSLILSEIMHLINGEFCNVFREIVFCSDAQTR